MRLAVVDASVALAWVLPDEEVGADALRLLLAYQGNQVRLLAPSLWAYEVLNALRVGVTRGRLTADEGAAASRALLDLGLTLTPLGETAARAWELALHHRLTIYDAAYLALAEHHQCALFTADKRLLTVAEGSSLARWVGEFG